MNVCFADTFFFLALWNARDAYHERVLSFAQQFRGKLVTTRWVLMEVADALAASAERRFVKGLLDRLDAESAITVVAFDEMLYQRGLALYHARPDKAWSLTDCLSFCVMEQDGIQEALTGDRHFAQAGFLPLFDDHA